MGAHGGSVVAVKEVASLVEKEDWSEERLLPGDIIERVTWMDGQLGAAAPFPNGKVGLESELRHIFRASDAPVLVWVRRAHGVVEKVLANVLSEEPVIPKKHYTLRSNQDVRHIVYLVDTTEAECLSWQESTMKILSSIKRKVDIHLDGTKKGIIINGSRKMVQDENIVQTYPWMQKVQCHLLLERSSMLFSMIFMPFQSVAVERVLYKGLEDTTACAMAWFCSAQAAGVPIIFVSIQTEDILKESSNDTRDLSDTTNKAYTQQLATYGRCKMACSDNTMKDVARAIRLWYIPPAAEVAIELCLDIGETKFGISMASNEEGFCYVKTVDDKSASDRAGMKDLLELATKKKKLLVISRVGEKKVVPWLVSCDGYIHCHSVSAIREQLSRLRETERCAQIHLMVWESSKEMERMSKPNLSMDFLCSTPPTSTPPTTKFKFDSTKRRISWTL